MNWYVEKSEQSLEGSIQDIANRTGQTIESVFANAKVAVLLDVSGSMRENDVKVGSGLELKHQSRFDAAAESLKRIQKLYQGYVAVVCFSDNVRFCPSGIPIFESGGTNLLSAMEYVKPLDGTGMKFIIITDGHPDNPQGCLDLKEEFSQPFEIIGIGDGANKEFLSKLGNFTGISTQTLSLEGIERKLLAAAVEE